MNTVNSKLQTPNSKLKVVVIGTRGFPNVQGGVEAHCQNLYPLLVKLGCDVIVFARQPYVGDKTYEYQGVKVVPISCPRNKFLEAFVHTRKAVYAAAKLKPDILHIHAVGPALLIPLVKKLGMRVVFTHHGPDYERKKWNWIAKSVLRLGEKRGARCADNVIAISETIAADLKQRFGRQVSVIPNGVTVPQPIQSDDALKRFDLEKGRYVLAVGRFVPEKGFHDLVGSWELGVGSSELGTGSSELGVRSLQTPSSKLQAPNYKLVIVGAADHEDDYSRSLKQQAGKNPNVVLTGYLSGQPLQELYSHAGLFVLPSYYEGLPIVLLEALSYGLSCLVSDIPANREVALADERYFKPGDLPGLARKLQEFSSKPLTEQERTAQISLIRTKYDWPTIAAQTLAVYRSLL